jgi:drug/metabolite transporter (DMT)-like permease
MPAQSRDVARHTFVGVVMVLASSIGFSSRGVLIKLSYPYGVDAVTLLALRMIFSLPLFALMAVFARQSETALTRSDWKMVVGLGFLGYYLSSYLSFLGLLYVPASLERLLLYLTPTMVVVLSAILFKQAIRRHHVLALGLTYGGILLVLVENMVITADPREIAIGALLGLGSALTFTVYLIASGTIIPRIGSARFTAYASGTACGFVIAQFMAIRDIESLALPMPVYGYAIAMALFCTVIPTWMMSEGIRRIGANQSSMLSSIGPVATIVLAAWVLGEPITTLQVAGSALVLAGVWLVGVKREAAPPVQTTR